MNRKIKIVAGAVIAFGALSLMGCENKATERYNDAPRSGSTNDAPADIITFPDGFSNVATKCDNGNRVYVIFHGDDIYGSVDVVPDDPTCP